MEATTADKRATDRSVERLVHEINEVIDNARPEEREELRQMAADLVRQESVHARVPTHDTAQQRVTRRPLNLVALGGFVLILGAGLALVIPPVGLILVGGGLATLVLGGLYRALTD
jgi:hypothetical protein